MSNLNELKNVLKETLDERGVLNEIRAKIRSEIYKSLEGPESKNIEKSKLSENNIINELIREYLEFNNYQYSLSVFVPETNLSETEKLDRNFMCKKLKVIEDAKSKEIPLLYSLIFGMKSVVGREDDREIMSQKFPNKEDVMESQKYDYNPYHQTIFKVDEPKSIVYKDKF